MEIIDEYGADAMRLALISVTTDASIIELDRRRFEEFRHFVNKIWNGARFVVSKLASEDAPAARLTDEDLYACTFDNCGLEDRWILSRLSKTTAKIIQSFEAYAFDKATTAVYEFFWNEFCAFYIEMSKSAFSSSAPYMLRSTKQALCLVLLIETIKLLHPFAPYITEELFSILKERFGSVDTQQCRSPRITEALDSLKNGFVCQASYPRVHHADESDTLEEQFQQLQQIASTVRAIRGEMKISPGIASDLYVVGSTLSSTGMLVKENERLLRSLIKLNTIEYVETVPTTVQLASRAPIQDLELVVPLPTEMREQETIRLKKAIEKTRGSSEKTQAQFDKLSSSGKAPAEVIEKLQISLDQQRRELAILEQQLSLLE
jgi:valyl-tRNA synthetase